MIYRQIHQPDTVFIYQHASIITHSSAATYTVVTASSRPSTLLVYRFIIKNHSVLNQKCARKEDIDCSSSYRLTLTGTDVAQVKQITE